MRVVLRELEDLGLSQAAVYDQLVMGSSEREIADTLGISAHTVHAHVKRIYKRLNVHSHKQMMRLLTERLKAKIVTADVERPPMLIL